MRAAAENDPFALTDAPVEKTARMQQNAPAHARTSPGSTSRPITPDAPTDWSMEAWRAREDRICRESAYASVAGWQLAAVIVKADDDLRQEVFCMHLISNS